MTQTKLQATTAWLLGVTGIFFGLHIYLFQSVPLFAPDSMSYIDFAPIRPIGYPAFLWVIHAFSQSYTILPYIQLATYELAAFYMVLGFYKLTRSWVLSLGVLIGTLLNIGFIQLSFSVLTDALGGSLLLMILGVILRFVHTPHGRYLYALTGLVGLACLLRPVSYSFISLLFALPFFRWDIFKHHFVKMIIGPLMVFLLILGVGMAGQALKNGFFRTESFLGNNLMGKVSLILEPQLPSSSPEFLAKITPASQKVQHVLSHAPDAHTRYLMAVPYYDIMRAKMVALLAHTPPLEADLLLRQLAFDVIYAKPLDYLQDVELHYRALWQCWDLCTFNEQRIYKETLAHTGALERGLDSGTTLRDKANERYGFPFIVFGIRTLFGLAFGASLIFALIGLIRLCHSRPLSPLLQAGVFTSLTIQSGYSVIALFQVGIARYSLSFWPCILLILAIALKSIMSYKRSQ